MRRKITLLLCAGLSLMTLFGIMRTINYTGFSANQNDSSSVKFRVESEHQTACLASADILSALQKMSFGNQSEADQEREILLEDSRKSPGCRKKLIATIMSAMDKPNLNFTSDPDSYYLWREGAELLGELKATEALDLLISHLDLNSGRFSTTMSQQPALKGVIKMGSAAIPKLDVVLRQSPDRNMRRYAVYCLTGIGGDVALRALKEALPSESDECVSHFISVSIDTLNNKSTRYLSAQEKWFSAFMCSD